MTDRLILGDCLEVMPTLEAASYDAARRAGRSRCAYLLAFGGTRTVHRQTCAIEDAGWAIRDVLVWAYAQGMPKSGSTLKPAWEPIVLAKAPGPLQPLQIDAARIPVADDDPVNDATWTVAESAIRPGTAGLMSSNEPGQRIPTKPPEGGRWPANLILTDPLFDGDVPGIEGGGQQRGGGNPRWQSAEAAAKSYSGWDHPPEGKLTGKLPVDTAGSYSRFFLVPKASQADREPILPLRREAAEARVNSHPTVKPLALMEHLVRLVTPPGGRILDPFAGSGTTLLAADQNGYEWTGIEMEEEHVRTFNARLRGRQRGLAL